jgi:hypothetical protein
MNSMKKLLTRAQASGIHNYARLTFIEIAKLKNRKKESRHSFICCGSARESSRIHDVTSTADFPTSEPDQVLDLTGLKLDCSLKSSCLIVVNKPSQAEEEAGLSSLVSLSGEEAAASCWRGCWFCSRSDLVIVFCCCKRSLPSKRSMQPHAVHSMRHPIDLRPTLLVVTIAPQRGSANPSAPSILVKATPSGT